MAIPILCGHKLQPAVDKLILENKSSREISAYCKDNGLVISHVAVARYMKESKDEIRTEVELRVEEIRNQAIEEQVTTQMFLQALIQKGYSKLLKGDYDDASLKDIVSAARVLVPTQIVADVTTSITMEDVITTLQVGEVDADE